MTHDEWMAKHEALDAKRSELVYRLSGRAAQYARQVLRDPAASHHHEEARRILAIDAEIDANFQACLDLRAEWQQAPATN